MTSISGVLVGLRSVGALSVVVCLGQPAVISPRFPRKELSPSQPPAWPIRLEVIGGPPLKTVGRLSPLAKLGFLMVGRSNMEFPRFHLFLDKEHGLSSYEVGPTGRNRNSMKGIPRTTCGLRFRIGDGTCAPTSLRYLHYDTCKPAASVNVWWALRARGGQGIHVAHQHWRDAINVFSIRLLAFRISVYVWYRRVEVMMIIWKRNVRGRCLTGDKLPPSETGRTVHFS